MATTVNIQALLGAAVHFGHQTRRWNPKMKPYIFGERNGIYIIDLKKTLIELDGAYSFVKELASKGKRVLFVGTKKQAQEPVSSNAIRSNMPYVNSRWLGGMLTNFVTIRSRVTHMEQLEAMEKDGRMASLPKKEQILLRKELAKLQNNLNGVRDMTAVPDAVFVVDTKREEIAIREARRLGIPVIGIIDTNADPDEVDFGIPGNDDAIRSVNLICEVIADAIIAGAGGGNVTAAEMAGSNETAAPVVAPVAAAAPAEKVVAAPVVPVASAEAPVKAPVEAPVEAPVVADVAAEAKEAVEEAAAEVEENVEVAEALVDATAEIAVDSAEKVADAAAEVADEAAEDTAAAKKPAAKKAPAKKPAAKKETTKKEPAAKAPAKKTAAKKDADDADAKDAAEEKKPAPKKRLTKAEKEAAEAAEKAAE